MSDLIERLRTLAALQLEDSETSTINEAVNEITALREQLAEARVLLQFHVCPNDLCVSGKIPDLDDAVAIDIRALYRAKEGPVPFKGSYKPCPDCEKVDAWLKRNEVEG